MNLFFPFILQFSLPFHVDLYLIINKSATFIVKIIIVYMIQLLRSCSSSEGVFINPH